MAESARPRFREHPILWAAEWATDNINKIASAVGAAAVWVFANMTEWARTLGPLGIALIVIGSALTIWLALSAASLFWQKTRLRRAETEEIGAWKTTVTINPLAPEYQRQRFKIQDLGHPITNRVVKRRFIDCELMGPANIFFLGPTHTYRGYVFTIAISLSCVGTSAFPSTTGCGWWSAPLLAGRSCNAL